MGNEPVLFLNRSFLLPMEDSYIQNALVQFIYHEMPADEASDFTQLILTTPELDAMYGQFLKAKTQMPKALFNPSSATLTNIMQYSAKTALEARV